MAAEREEQIEVLVRQYRERLEQSLPAGPRDLNQIEDLARKLGQDVQRDLTEEFVREEVERREGNQTACPCGDTARFRGRYAREIVTAAGRVRVRRAYFHCAGCGSGHCPADAWLGLGPANTTPTAQAHLAGLAARVPYTQVNDVLAQLGLPLSLDVKSIEQVAQRVGQRLELGPPPSCGPAERGVALGFDGVMIPTWDGYKEARVGVVYEPDWEAGRTPDAEASLRKEYCATTGSRESLVAAVCARARERARGGVVAVVCDGAALDWVELDRYLPLRVEILDFYHVLERLALLAGVLHPGDAASAERWRTAMKQELLAFGPWKLLEALRAWEPESAVAREVRRVQLAYFARQQERMRYPAYLRRGFPIGSGAVEGACKHVVADRFAGGGMRWKLATANPVMQLRAAILTQPRLDLRSLAGRTVAA